MKKSIILCAIAIATIAAFQSCRKQEPPKPPIITNLNITLKQNEAYTFTLPANTTKSPYKFVTQASHYTISTVSKDASNNDIYQYTPSSNYTGTDNVTIADTKDGDCHNGNNPPPQGGCAHHHHHGKERYRNEHFDESETSFA